MKKGAHIWMVRLAAAADTDFQDIIRWTVIQFGARRYAQILSSAVSSLTGGPTIAGVKQRNEIVAGLHTLHVARRGRKARHFLMFRVVEEQSRCIEILRILHDAADLSRHAP